MEGESFQTRREFNFMASNWPIICFAPPHFGRRTKFLLRQSRAFASKARGLERIRRLIKKNSPENFQLTKPRISRYSGIYMHEGLNRVIMAVGAHADDLELSMGGTLLKYFDADYRIVYVMSTNNMSGGVREYEDGKYVTRPNLGPSENMELRKREAAAAAAVLGTEPIHLDHPQRHYNSLDEKRKQTVCFGSPLPSGMEPGTPTILTAQEDEKSIQRVADLILKENPELVFTHPIATQNVEHFCTSLLVTAGFWEAVERGYQGGLLTWKEAITFLGDSANGWDTFVDYSGYMDRKMALAALHACQKPDAMEPDFGWRKLGTFWGRACGVQSAECFRWVQRPLRLDRKICGKPQPLMGELGNELTRNSR